MPKRIPKWFARNFTMIVSTIVMAAVGVLIVLSLLQIRDELKRRTDQTEPAPQVTIIVSPPPGNDTASQGGVSTSGRGFVLSGSNVGSRGSTAGQNGQNSAPGQPGMPGSPGQPGQPGVDLTPLVDPATGIVCGLFNCR